MYYCLDFVHRIVFFFFSSRRRHTRSTRDWSSDVCSSDLRGSPCRSPGGRPRSGASRSATTRHSREGAGSRPIRGECRSGTGRRFRRRRRIRGSGPSRRPPPRSHDIVPFMSAAARLAEFVVKTSLEDCPSEAVARVRRAALDTLGVMLAGAAEPVARIVRRVVRAEGGIALATVVGTALKTAPGWAALANGAAGHAHDFDDTNFALLGHPSVPLLSTALAAAEAETATGRALVLSYVIGFEVDVALGTALNPNHYTRGWHATSSIGTLGCTAAAARIMGLDVVQTRHALAIAASHASGLKENFGSMTKPYHAGHAARNGILAAQLAREGLTASETALEGRQGYVAAFGASHGLDQALEGLGHAWHLLGSGIAVKPYPSCALTHSAIDALIDLRAAHRLSPGDIAAVQVGVNRVVPDVLAHPRPTTALERKFSMQFCAAAALVDGRVDFGSFMDGEVANPE